ncbi:universal stress protein [Algirhabdus cladophorae]|uniref:universal stress protein n=1 Tax=Algirhabdus cladophorae TaxID=3377108 RepID=UPI003B847CC5
MGKIIALVDGSVYSQSVCDHAAWVSSRNGYDVEVVHVLGHRQGAKQNLSGNIGLGARSKLMDELAELDAERAKLAQKRGRAILEDAEERIRAGGAATVSTKLRNGDLVTELAQLAKGADLVCVGKRGEAADFAKLHLGSNLERVVRSCEVPILVTSRAFKPIKNFLIAFDGGSSSLKAVKMVADSQLFKDLNAHVVTIGQDDTETKRKIEGAAASLKTAGYAPQTQITQGAPEEVISKRTEDGSIDMLVMGAYGHSRIRSMIIGSTTTEMIRSCQVPLLLFR